MTPANDEPGGADSCVKPPVRLLAPADVLGLIDDAHQAGASSDWQSGMRGTDPCLTWPTETHAAEPAEPIE